jgi:nucleoside-diphosphate kinase
MTHPKEERTYLMIKPDGVRKGLIGEIIKRIEQRDLKVVALEMHQPTEDEMNDHYPQDEAWVTRLGQKTMATYTRYGYDPITEMGTESELEAGRQVRGWLVSYMCSAPIVKVVVQGVHAVDMVRKIVGQTLPYLAEMGTIRGDYSCDSPIVANKEKRAVMNLVHASDTADEAEREIKHWFGDRLIKNYQRYGIDD